MKLKLTTTDDEYHSLTQAAFPERIKGECVRVNRQALANLMKDHAAVLAKLKGEYE